MWLLAPFEYYKLSNIPLKHFLTKEVTNSPECRKCMSLPPLPFFARPPASPGPNNFCYDRAELCNDLFMGLSSHCEWELSCWRPSQDCSHDRLSAHLVPPSHLFTGSWDESGQTNWSQTQPGNQDWAGRRPIYNSMLEWAPVEATDQAIVMECLRRRSPDIWAPPSIGRDVALHHFPHHRFQGQLSILSSHHRCL